MSRAMRIVRLPRAAGDRKGVKFTRWARRRWGGRSHDREFAKVAHQFLNSSIPNSE